MKSERLLYTSSPFNWINIFKKILLGMIILLFFVWRWHKQQMSAIVGEPQKPVELSKPEPEEKKKPEGEEESF